MVPVLSIVGITLLAGCALFPEGMSAEKVETRRPTLPPIQAAPDSIQLEVLFVERPADDPLLTKLIWAEVDQIASIPAETRELLLQNGMRVALAGSNPPPTVQKLLGMVSGGSNSAVDSKRMVGSRKLLPPGVDTEVQTAENYETCHLKLIQGDNVKLLDYQQARCLFRMNSNRLQDGWIRVTFQPEIHHGENRVRHTPTEDGWAFRSRQNVDARHSHQFSLTMNVGEIALITAAPEMPESLGELFFCRDDNGIKKQRVLIVRVADAGQE